VIDNMIPETANMIIKAKYVIAHTPNVELRWASEGRRNRRNENQQENNILDAGNLEAQIRDELAYAKMSQVRAKNL